MSVVYPAVKTPLSSLCRTIPPQNENISSLPKLSHIRINRIKEPFSFFLFTPRFEAATCWPVLLLPLPSFGLCVWEAEVGWSLWTHCTGNVGVGWMVQAVVVVSPLPFFLLPSSVSLGFPDGQTIFFLIFESQNCDYFLFNCAECACLNLCAFCA